jgi:NAD(P)H-nitrite reductase large subunit
MSLPGPAKTRARKSRKAKRLCSCNKLSTCDIATAIQCGADSVKTCMRHHGVMPKCGDCVPLIRKKLAKHRAAHTEPLLTA